MNVDEVIKLIYEQTKQSVNYSDIAKIIGIGRQTVSYYKTANRELPIEYIDKIGGHFGIDFSKINLKQIQQNILEKRLDYLEQQDDFQANYFPDVFGSCGSGSFVLSETKEYMNIPKNAVKAYCSHKTYSVITANGDSMLPEIHDNDFLIVEHIEDCEQITDNRIYVFSYDDQIFVKRLVKNVNELVIISDNPDKDIYKTIRLEKEEMNRVIIIGEIVGIMRKMK